jgi:hypothetical protein
MMFWAGVSLGVGFLSWVGVVVQDQGQDAVSLFKITGRMPMLLFLRLVRLKDRAGSSAAAESRVPADSRFFN